MYHARHRAVSDDITKMETRDSARLEPALRQQPSPEDADLAGLTLVTLANRNTDVKQANPTEDFRNQLAECFGAGTGHPSFEKHHVEALRITLKAGHLEIASNLLKLDSTHSFLAHEMDLIQLAINTETSRSHTYGREPEDMPQLVQRMISYGAPINAVDEKGNTPLYYVCKAGYAASFNILVAAGAELRTSHEALPDSNHDKEESVTVASGKESSKVNLLDVTLESHLKSSKGRPISEIWNDPQHKDWWDIIVFLLDKGLTFRRTDPRLAKFLQISCYQGCTTYVQKLLDVGVDENARPARADSQDHVYGSALHTAVIGGQSAVVTILLDHGADIHTPRLCIDRLQGRGMRPLARAFQWGTLGLPVGRTALDVLHACEILVSAGADNDDCKILLEQCAKQGHLEMATRLLDRIIATSEVPNIQRYAVKTAHLDLMDILFKKYGLALPMEDFGYIAFDIMRGTSPSSMTMLRLLITEYGLDVNTTFPGYPGATYHVNLLQRACEECKPAAVQLLLEAGADPQCPGLPESAWAYLKKELRNRGLSVGRFAAEQMPIIRLLLQRSNDNWEHPVMDIPRTPRATDPQSSWGGQGQLRSRQLREMQPIFPLNKSRYS